MSILENRDESVMPGYLIDKIQPVPGESQVTDKATQTIDVKKKGVYIIITFILCIIITFVNSIHCVFCSVSKYHVQK